MATALELTLARLAGDPPRYAPPPPGCCARVRPQARRPVSRRATSEPATSAPATSTSPGIAPAASAPAGPVSPGSGSAGLASGRPAADPPSTDDADLRAVAGTALGLVELACGALPAGRFVRAREAAREAGRPRTELVGASRSALLLAVRGDLHAAERAARDALGMPPCRGWSCRLDCSYAYLALAVVALHRDQPEEAGANLALAAQATGPVGTVEAGSGSSSTAGEPVAAALAAWCGAHLHRDAGDPATGQRMLVRARESLPDEPSAAELSGLLLAAEAEIRAWRGDLDAARTLLADATADGRRPGARRGPGPGRAARR